MACFTRTYGPCYCWAFQREIRMKLFHKYFSSLRNSEIWSPLAALSIFWLCALATTPHASARELLLRHSDIVDYMCCLVGAILVGYTLVVGMMNGPTQNVTVEAQENTSETETFKKRYLKI